METIFITFAILLLSIVLYRLIKMIFFPRYRIIQRKRYSFSGGKTEYYIQKTDIIGWEYIHHMGHDTIDDALIGLDNYKKNIKSPSIVVFKK